MFNYKLTIQYDGTNYAGWQIQKEGKTVQGEIKAAIEKVLQNEINLVGSGRTDSGVHALGQVANFRYHKDLDLYKFRHSLNSLTDTDIAITEVKKVDKDFHSRFDATRRSYLYLISHDKSPFYDRFSYQYSPVVQYSMDELNELSKIYLGEHDFTSLCRTKTEIENKVCFINNIHWRSNKNFTLFHVEANRFLHGMVRTLVGTLLHAIKNDLDYSYLLKVLEEEDRQAAAEAVSAKGLFLYKVRY